jgi:uncharacterized 2Fe-2S/4Fe-4S cluster protein (DUF4445 family)
MPAVHFVDQGLRLEVAPGRTILEAARELKLSLESPCSGVGTCGKCRVRLLRPEQRENLAVTEARYRLGDEERQQGYILACHARIYGDVEVAAGSKDTENKSLRILARGNTFDYPLQPFIEKRFDGKVTGVFGGGRLLGEEPGDTSSEIYGIAMDIGTTTLVTELIDLRTGAVVSSDSMLNPQSAYAQDVLTRIHFAASREDGLEILHEAFLGAFRTMLKHITAGIKQERIYEVVFSGNTTMLHLAAGIDPSSLGKYPYIMKIQGGEERPADGLRISPLGLVYLPPLISAFVGADIISGILVSQLAKKEGITLFIDIGTNGEMVLARNGTLSATSTAAGPAFEGMNIDCGMRAANGAVEQFHINDGVDAAVEFSVIGGGQATGICGSGLVDIAGELVRTGTLGKNGRFVPADSPGIPESVRKCLRNREGKTAFFITENVYVTQKDIRQIQLAKGAVRAGISALLKRMGVSGDEVDRVEIAGSFGYHLRENSLLDIGLLPPAFKGKVHFTGNTSQSGAAAFLLNTSFREQMKETAALVEKVELANTPDFERLFVNSLGF